VSESCPTTSLSLSFHTRSTRRIRLLVFILVAEPTASSQHAFLPVIAPATGFGLCVHCFPPLLLLEHSFAIAGLALQRVGILFGLGGLRWCFISGAVFVSVAAILAVSLDAPGMVARGIVTVSKGLGSVAARAFPILVSLAVSIPVAIAVFFTFTVSIAIPFAVTVAVTLFFSFSVTIAITVSVTITVTIPPSGVSVSISIPVAVTFFFAATGAVLPRDGRSALRTGGGLLYNPRKTIDVMRNSVAAATPAPAATTAMGPMGPTCTSAIPFLVPSVR
jgi:hypothetical protein